MPITQTHPYHHLKDRIEQGSRRRIRHLPEFLSPHRCWKEAPKGSTFRSSGVATLWRGREWYQTHLRRAQRNVGAVLALELSIEAAAMYARDDRQWRFLQYARDYAATMRAASTGRPSAVSVAHADWISTDAPDDFWFPNYFDETNLGRLRRVVSWCSQFFQSHTGNAYDDGWSAMHEWCRLAVQADLVDSRYEAFALWWHTLRCRLAFRDSSHCVFV